MDCGGTTARTRTNWVPPYPELEWAMRWEAQEAPRDEEGLSWREKQVLETYRRFHRANKHKMEPIPVCLIPEDVRNV